MKLYLSSYGLGNKPEYFAKLIGSNKKTAVIMNAQDLVLPDRRIDRLKVENENLVWLGLDPKELDLRDFFNNPETMTSELTKYGAVWIRGGNVFVLMRAMMQSGFSKAMIPYVKNDSIVYAGFSAGSCAATPTLHGIELVDDSETVPNGYLKDTVWDGLGLVNFSIAPHFRSDHPESEAIEKTVQYFKEHKMTYKALHDGQAIVINSEIQTVVG